MSYGLSDMIRTCDLYHPKVALYQTEPHPDFWGTLLDSPLVRVTGLEPAHRNLHKNLNLTRLPIPPHPHIKLCPTPKLGSRGMGYILKDRKSTRLNSSH